MGPGKAWLIILHHERVPNLDYSPVITLRS